MSSSGSTGCVTITLQLEESRHSWLREYVRGKRRELSTERRSEKTVTLLAGEVSTTKDRFKNLHTFIPHLVIHSTSQFMIIIIVIIIIITNA